MRLISHAGQLLRDKRDEKRSSDQNFRFRWIAFSRASVPSSSSFTKSVSTQPGRSSGYHGGPVRGQEELFQLTGLEEDAHLAQYLRVASMSFSSPLLAPCYANFAPCEAENRSLFFVEVTEFKLLSNYLILHLIVDESQARF